MKSPTNEYIGLLISKHLLNEIDEDERKELENWIHASAANKEKFEELTDTKKLFQKLSDWEQAGADKDMIWQKLELNLQAPPAPVVGTTGIIRRLHWTRIAAAAILLLAVGVGVYMITSRRVKQPVVATTQTTSKTQDLAPGGNKAVLTLADGSTIILDNAQNGLIAEQDKTAINKTQDGELVYSNDPERSRRAHSPALSDVEGPTRFNTVTTPRGGQYQLSLPDGSKVWLNAASSIRFPVSFAGAARTVQLTGEAYFEVAHVTLPGSAARMPFEVQVNNGMKVQVLGTHFNIMAYDEEKEAKTTLLQGKVKVVRETNSSTPTSVFLQPGQQALLADANLRVQKDANVAEAVAWKNGLFKFAKTDLKTVMRQLARWYDVQVEYAPGVPEKYFTGEISRRLNASEVLSVIEFAGVHWRIEGKKIIVIP